MQKMHHSILITFRLMQSFIQSIFFYRPKKTGGKAGLMLTHSVPGVVWVSRLPTNFFRLSATFVQALANQQLRQNLHQKLEDFNVSVYILYCYDLLQNTVNQQ